MISAKEARERTKMNYKEEKWGMLDAIQLKWINLKIKIAIKRGRDYIFIDGTRPLVRGKLEKMKYRFVCFGGGNVAQGGITWNET